MRQSFGMQCRSIWTSTFWTVGSGTPGPRLECAGPIVMNSPQFEDPSEMVRVERNHEIQTRSACTTNQALTNAFASGNRYGVLKTLRPNVRSEESSSRE